MSPLDLRSAAWPDIAEAAAQADLLLVVPLGSCEQHGPHLPLDVDAVVVQAVARHAYAHLSRTALAPALPYGASGEHEGFAGTLSLGTAALTIALLELGRSAARWAGQVLFVNGHGGNVDALVAATQQLRHESRDAAWWSCDVPGGDAHAGRAETSLLLALRPAAVQLDRARPGCTTPLPELLPALRSGGVRAVAPSGVLGDPTGASGVEGEALLSDLVLLLISAVSRWQVAPSGRLLPT